MIVGGVPEHFNLAAWQYLNTAGASHGVRTKFIAVPGGTGAMMAALSSGSVDVAIALTEGIVAAAATPSGPEDEIVIVAPYVDSPLAWGIATGSEQAGAFESLSCLGDLEEIRVGVSRMGSGSHLMSFLLAEREGWDVRKLRFVICKDINGLRKAVCAEPGSEGHAHLFLWETGMIDPFVLAGELSRIGIVPTPWPCFLMAARRQWLEASVEGATNRERFRAVLPGVRGALASFVADPATALDAIAARFMVRRAAAAAWLREVRFAGSSAIRRDVLGGVVETLHRLGILTAEQAELVQPHTLVDESLVALVDDSPGGAAAPKGASPAGAAAGGAIRADASRLEQLLAGSPLKPAGRGQGEPDPGWPESGAEALAALAGEAETLVPTRSIGAEALAALASEAGAAAAAETASGGDAAAVEAASEARLRVLGALDRYLASMGASGVQGMQ